MSLPSNGNTRYLGQATPAFKLAFVTGLLTLLTAGIYRFWAKTRMRKYIWSSVSFDGDTFEYTGTGLEKLLGFLIAIVFLAVYLAGIQLILTFIGLGLVNNPDNELAILGSVYLSFFAVAPFLLFAIYRARRYKLARTRLRGIRFGMDPAAWGYAFRAMGHYLLTIITLGILLPRQSFYLEKFMTDRSHYGDARFEQGGRWQGLYGAMKHLFIGLGLMIAGAVLATAVAPTLGIISIVIGYVWLMLGFLYYRVHSYAYLANHKTLGGQVTFNAAPRVTVILKTLVLGSIAVSLAGGVAFSVLAAVMVALFGGMGAEMGMGMGPNIAALVPLIIGYLLIFVALGALTIVMITQPIIAHLVNNLQVNNTQALGDIRQRHYDSGADADGFADALDVGGAI